MASASAVLEGAVTPLAEVRVKSYGKRVEFEEKCGIIKVVRNFGEQYCRTVSDIFSKL